MNNFPRIKELKIQACKWASENAAVTEYENAADQKFAELIVKECAGIVQTYMSRWPEDAELTKQIKQHFGVE